jgi:DNA-binding PadR family transcriptional regulator
MCKYRNSSEIYKAVVYINIQTTIKIRVKVLENSKALKRLIRKLTVETLWIYVVKVLMVYGPMKAYDIKKKLYEFFGLKVPTITVYSVVYKLCSEGILEQVKTGSDVVYKVTDKGVAEYRKALGFIEDIVSKLRL